MSSATTTAGDAPVIRITDGDGDPDCAVCHGMGWVTLRVPMDDPYFGKVLPCHACRGHAEELRLRREFEAKRACIARYTTTLPQQTFASFDTRRVGALIRVAFAGAQVYAKDLDGWLVLHGSYGTGKSHLASAIVNHCHDQQAMSLTVPEMLEMLKGGFKNGDYSELLDLCRTVDLLVLDDIGTENPTEWACEKLFQIVNHRYNHRLPTVFVLNGKPDDLAPRIASRISDTALARTYPMYGDDYRRRETRR